MMVEELLMQEREEWIEEGRMIGRLETKVSDILTVLQLKGDVPEETGRKIRLIENPEDLDLIFRYALTHKNLAEIGDYIDGIMAAV